MVVARLAEGLWRWTERHHEWTPGQDWEPDVGSVYCEAFGDVLLIDPLLPGDGDERERFWRALDRDVTRAAGPLHILLTCAWHARSSAEIGARYPGAATRIAKPGAALPGKVTAVEAVPGEEVVLWLPSHDALVTGDVLLGDDEGGLRLCPDSWLGGRDPESVRTGLAGRLAPLDVERVLVSHGAPVLSGARAALDRALRTGP